MYTAAGSWFTTSNRRYSDSDPPKPSFNAALPPRQDQPAEDDGTLGRPSYYRAITAPMSTPHDAVLSELNRAPKSTGATGEQRSQTMPGSSAPPINRDVSAAASDRPGEDASTQDPGSAQGLRSAATTPAPAPSSSGAEHIYDPFTGTVTGILYPLVPERDPPATAMVDSADSTRRWKKDSLLFDTAKDDLWSQLARIRDLQSEIAGMHVHMEGIGTSDGGRGGQKRQPGPTRMRTDTIGVTDEWVDAEQEAKAREKARDAEFTKLTESFEGRRAAIDDIMGKVRRNRFVSTEARTDVCQPFCSLTTSRRLLPPSTPFPHPKSTCCSGTIPRTRPRLPSSVVRRLCSPTLHLRLRLCRPLLRTADEEEGQCIVTWGRSYGRTLE